MARQIPFVSQQRIQIRYKEHILSKEYVADMVCYDKIIVEFKALDALTGRVVARRKDRFLVKMKFGESRIWKLQA